MIKNVGDEQNGGDDGKRPLVAVRNVGNDEGRKEKRVTRVHPFPSRQANPRDCCHAKWGCGG